MAQNVTVTPDNFAKTLDKLLDKYKEDAYNICESVAKTSARQATSALKKTSAVGAIGRYARGWSHKAEKKGTLFYTDTVYNRTDYQLTHLLEKPHDTGYGGHYPKYNDHTGEIAAVEDNFTQRFFNGVVNKL